MMPQSPATLLARAIDQLRSERRVLLFGFGPALLLLLVLALQRQIPVQHLTADAVSLTQAPIYFGLVSNLGLLVWGAAFTICMLSARLLWGSGPWAGFFLASGGITLLLLVDDMLMLHESIVPSIGVPEQVFSMIYPTIAVVHGFVFWRLLKQTHFLLILLALGLMGVSLVIDLTHRELVRIFQDVRRELALEPQRAPNEVTPSAEPEGTAPSLGQNLYHVAEDGTKFLGIIAWTLYLSTVARNRILARFAVPDVAISRAA